MARVIEIDGFLVEIEPELEVLNAQENEALEAGGLDVGGRALRSFEGLRTSIQGLCTGVRDAFTEANKPDELTLSFAIKFGGGAGIPYIAKGTAEASVTVTAKWVNTPPPTLAAATRGAPPPAAATPGAPPPAAQ